VEYVAILKLWTVVNMGLDDYRGEHAAIWREGEAELTESQNVIAIPSHFLFRDYSTIHL